jgi:septum formation protein
MLSPCSSALRGKKQRRLNGVGGKKQQMRGSALLRFNPDAVSSTKPSLPVILASSSKGRREIMSQLFGDKFSTMLPDIDEKAVRHPDPKQLPLYVARAKMDAMVTRVSVPSIIVCADQIVLFNGTVREKPADEKQARDFLASYSNRSCETVSALVVHNTVSKETVEEVHVATIKFMEISSDVVDRVIGRGQIYQSAGGFRVEDEDLKPLVKELVGGYDSVLGLPGPTLLKLMTKVGYDVSKIDISNVPQFECGSNTGAPTIEPVATAAAVGVRRSPRANQPRSGSLR